MKNKRRVKKVQLNYAFANDYTVRNKNSNEGITLIALVVTIVVLLILAGVTLNLVIGDNGLITKAKDAKAATEQAAINDQIAMNSLYEQLIGLETGTSGGEDVGGTGTSGGGSGDTVGKVTVGTKASKNSTINGEEPSATNPIIPEGYTPIDTDTTSWGNGTTAPTEENVNKGLVITDDNNNEWVWVPVPTPSDLYETASPAISITGGSGKTVVSGVSTSKYTKSSMIGFRDLPNSTSYREPDVIVGDEVADCDAADTNRAAAGFTKIVNGATTTMTVSEMAQVMVNDYEDMIDSLETYKGFYIGRYELSSAGIKKNQPTLTNTNWYNLYAKCKEFNASDKVETRMIWGLQWDATCNWIANNGDRKSITNSQDWGNYTDSTAPANTGNYEKNVKKNTGSNEAWKANNIYDLAGNCWEWTQEACGTNARVASGGSAFEEDYSFSFLYGNAVGNEWDVKTTTRPTLIVQP